MIEYDFKFGWNHYKFMVFRAKTEKTQIKANQNVLQNFGEKIPILDQSELFTPLDLS